MKDRNGVEVNIGDEVQVPQSRIYTMPKGIVFYMDGEFIHFRDHHGRESPDAPSLDLSMFGLHIDQDLVMDKGL